MHSGAAPGCRLVRQLRIDPAGELSFTGMTRGGRVAPGRSFGGGVIAQALLAAGATVAGGAGADGQAPGSLHVYFVTPGDAGRPMRYSVGGVADGASWALRQVTADQGGTVRLVMHASFRRFGSSAGSEHQRAVPAGPLDGPPVGADDGGADRSGACGDSDGGGCSCPDGVHLPECGLDVREAAGPGEPGTATGAERALWVRVRHDLGDSPLWHAALLAYASDVGALAVANGPHAGEPGMLRGASVDYAMWFHRTFRFDDWLWYWQRSPVLAGGRALLEGSFYDSGGRLVASCAQELAIRRIARR